MGKKRPTHEIKLEKIRAAIWANESKQGQALVQRYGDPALQGRRSMERYVVVWTRRSSNRQQSN